MANDRARSLFKSRGFQVLIVVVVAAVVAIIFWRGGSKAPTYFTSPVRTGNIVSMVQATGTVNPIHTISIGSQVSGKVVQIYVDFNTKVKKGQLLAQIDPTVYQNQVNSAKSDLANAQAAVTASEAQVAVAQANLVSAQANVEKAQAALTQAKLQWDRTRNLLKQGIVSASQGDTDKATYDTDVAGLDSAKAGLKQSQASLTAAKANLAEAKANVQIRDASLKTAQTNLDYCNIIAPANGTIVNRLVDIGQTVAASFNTPNMFTEATDLNTMYVYTQTDESDIGRLKVGDDATFTVDAYPNVTYHGTVLQRRMAATTVQNVVEYDTIIQFHNAGERLFPGMTAYVNIPVARANDVLEVPNSALRFKPSLTPAELRATLAKYGMNPNSGPGNGGGARSDTGAAEAGNGGGRPGGGRGGRGGFGGGRGGFGGRRGGNGGGQMLASSDRPAVNIIWKLDANGNLVPVRVLTGITDFTYTAVNRVLQGSLKNGDEVVTGALTSSSSGGPGGRRGPGRMF